MNHSSRILKTCILGLALGFMCLIVTSSAHAVRDFNSPFERWYIGDWVGESKDGKGRDIVYGLRFETINGRPKGCIIYPNGEKPDRKIFARIYERKRSKFNLRFSNGKEVVMHKQENGKRKVGQNKDANVTLVMKDGGKSKPTAKKSKGSIEFKKQFLPANCI